MLKIDFYTVEYSSAIRATGRLILYSGSYWVIPSGVWEYDWEDDRGATDRLARAIREDGLHQRIRH